MNNYENTNATYYQPSGETEKRTHAMNRLLWGFVFMGVFILWILFWIIEIIAVTVSGITDTFLQRNIMVIVIVSVIAVILGTILGRRFMQQYLIYIRLCEKRACNIQALLIYACI